MVRKILPFVSIKFVTQGEVPSHEHQEVIYINDRVQRMNILPETRTLADDTGVVIFGTVCLNYYSV